jgi:hypothetical protein
VGIQDIVNVQITRQTAAVSEQGFGTALFVGEATVINTTERIRYYDSLEAVADDFGPATKEYDAALAYFSQQPSPRLMAIGRRDGVTPETYTEALDAIREVSDDWYGLAIESRSTAQQLEVATWAEANEKLFATADNDTNIVNQAQGVDTTSIASELQDAALARSFVVYHDTSDGSVANDRWPDLAWLGRMLPTQPGSATWAFKTLAGVPVVQLTSTQRKNALDKNANTYEVRGGVNITRDGTTGSGEYIDIIVGVDWLKARMTERIYSKLVNLPKIPYTDAGIAIVEAEVRAQLADGIAAGLLAADPAPVVTVPKAKDVPTNDKAQRILRNVRFTATLAGAVHAVEVNGVVTL